jgi:hypothetical protein
MGDVDTAKQIQALRLDLTPAEGNAFRANCPVVFVADKTTELVVTALGYYEGN